MKRITDPLRRTIFSGCVVFSVMALILLGLSCGLMEKSEAKVVISVGNKKVTADQLKKDIRRITSGMGIAREDIRHSLKPLIDSIVDHYLVMEYSRLEGLHVSKAELGAAVEDIKQDYTEKGFKEIMLRKYVDYDDWEEGIRQQILIKKIMTNVTARVEPITSNEIEQYYESNKATFKQPEMVRFRQIIARTRSKADDLRKRIVGGEKLLDIARESQLVPEMESGGEVDWIAGDVLEETLQKAVMSLPIGETSPVIKTPYGYHIIEVTGKRPQGLRSLPEVKNEIEVKLLMERKASFYKSWLRGLRKNFTVTINQDLLEKMEFE